MVPQNEWFIMENPINMGVSNQILSSSEPRKKPS